MPSFEEEAFERARQMSFNRAKAEEPRRRPAEPAPVKPAQEQPKPPMPPKPPEPKQLSAAPNMMETLFRNRENSLIVMLLLLLMDEKNDPSLLFTLMYLLM